MVMIQPQVPLPPNLSTEVILSISCENLKDLNILLKSDPMCKIYNWNERTRDWVFFGETECIKNSLNPKFKTTFQVEYIFEKNQRLKSEVFD